MDSCMAEQSVGPTWSDQPRRLFFNHRDCIFDILRLLNAVVNCLLGCRQLLTCHF